MLAPNSRAYIKSDTSRPEIERGVQNDPRKERTKASMRDIWRSSQEVTCNLHFGSVQGREKNTANWHLTWFLTLLLPLSWSDFQLLKKTFLQTAINICCVHELFARPNIIGLTHHSKENKYIIYFKTLSQFILFTKFPIK